MNDQQNIGSKSPSERVYAFADLPKDAQEKLLKLQNTDGDFLKLSSGETERRIVLLVIVILIAIGLAAIIADSASDLKRIIIFFVDALVLLLWFVYLVAKIHKAVSSPIKNRIYITPTQSIETMDGTVRYRQLKDAAEISVNKFSTDIGRRNKLNIEFDDGDVYQFYIAGMTNSKQISLMQKWQERAAKWKTEAINAFQRGETNYFETHDVISIIADADTPILQRQNRTRKENLLLILTIALLAINGGLVFFLNK